MLRDCRETKETKEALASVKGECEQMKMAGEAMERENRNIKKTLLTLTSESNSLRCLSISNTPRGLDQCLSLEPLRQCSAWASVFLL